MIVGMQMRVRLPGGGSLGATGWIELVRWLVRIKLRSGGLVVQQLVPEKARLTPGSPLALVVWPGGGPGRRHVRDELGTAETIGRGAQRPRPPRCPPPNARGAAPSVKRFGLRPAGDCCRGM